MKLQKTLLATLVAASLSACGGGDSSSTAPTKPSVIEPTKPSVIEPTKPSVIEPTVSGKAADGYLQNATVCLDLNKNRVCDSGEPFTTTDENGVYNLKATQEQINAHSLLVEVVAGKTTDSDNPGAAIEKGYVLGALPGANFVSPLTTLLLNEIENGTSKEEAIEKIKLSLGTKVDITADYIEGKKNSEQSSAYEAIHRVAQVTARVFAEKLDEVADQAAQQGISKTRLMEVIANEVWSSLEDIAKKANQQGDNFDADNLADEIKDLVDVSKDNIQNKIELIDADRASTATTITELTRNEGLVWFESSRDVTTTLEFGVIEMDEEGDITEWELKSNENYTDFEQISRSFLDYVLTKSGWQLAQDSIESIVSNDDSETLVTTTPELSIEATLKKVDVSGLSIRTVLAQTADELNAWSKVYPQEATFPDGTLAYKLNTRYLNQEYLHLKGGDWCGDVAEDRGGMCNSLEIIQYEAGVKLATSLREITFESANDDAAGKVVVGGTDKGPILAEFLAGGTVNYYVWNYSGSLEKAIASGTWADNTIYGETVRKVTAPPAVTNMSGVAWDNFALDANLYLSVFNGFVRVLATTPTVSNEEYVFDTGVLEVLIDGLLGQESLTLGQCLESLDDAQYLAYQGDSVEYSAEQILAGSNTRLFYDEKITYLGGNEEYYYKGAQVRGLPEWTEAPMHADFFLRSDKKGNELLEEIQYGSVDGFHGWRTTAPGTDDVYGVMITPKTPNVSNSRSLINQPITLVQERVLLSDLDNAVENDIHYNELPKTLFSVDTTYLGKETVTVPAGTFEACVIKETFAGGSNTAWLINRGTIKRSFDEPSWVDYYVREATKLPPMSPPI